jgi:hypothetical protein
MDRRMSRLDKAKAEREKLQAEAEHHRAQAEHHLARASEKEQKVQEADIFIRWWEQLSEGESDDDGVSREHRSAEFSNGTHPSPFYGMGQPGAVTLFLQMKRGNLTTVEVTQGLQENGFEFATKDPVRAVEWALKRASEAGHVIKVDRSLWKASPNADPAALETNSRSARTIAGLKVAQRRGVRLGSPPKITEEHRQLAVSLFERGETIDEIAKKCGVTSAGMGARIRRWRAGGLFPPPRPKGRRKKPEPEDRDRGMVH